MPRQPWFWLLAVMLWSATSSGAEPGLSREPSLRMFRGGTKVFTLPREVRGFAVRDEELLDVRFIGNHQIAVVASPELQGDTVLLFFGPEGPVRRFDIQVRSGEIVDRICELCRFLPKKTLIELDITGETLTVRGTALSLEDIRGVKLIREVYPSLFRQAHPSVFIDVQLVDRVLREALLHINHQLWRAGFLDASAIVVGDRVVLTGHFASRSDEARAHLTLAPYAEWLEDRLLPTPQPAP